MVGAWTGDGVGVGLGVEVGGGVGEGVAEGVGVGEPPSAILVITQRWRPSRRSFFAKPTSLTEQSAEALRKR